MPGTTLADSEAAAALADPTAGVFAAVGVHPHEAKDFEPARDGARFEALAGKPGVVAIGEIGLDFHYDHSPREKQIEVLEWMLDCARRLGLPVLLHNRESGAEMLAALDAAGRATDAGVFHSFTEDAAYGAKAIDLGYLVSFSGMITFRAAENIRGRRGGPAARSHARRDRHAVSRARAPSRQALRAGVRRRDGEEAGRGQGHEPRGGGRRDDGELRPSLRPRRPDVESATGGLMPLAPGDRVGAYEILASLGAGGMGEVYRARDTRLGRETAVKVLPEELAADRDRLVRFEQEARAASALNHPNIVTIYEVGFEGERPFLAMELVDGKSLREIVVSGALPVRRMLSIAVQIAEGLAKAHAAGIVHRDLKPENVMVSKDGFVKILDFGLAKLVEPDSGGVSAMPTLARPETRPGVVMGTVGYMSPEQASGEPLDYRSDQFSLGSMLYEMATGRKAFQRKTAAETLSAIIREDPESAGKIRPDLPPPVRWILERCLAKDPEERYTSTRDLARELAAVRDHISEVSSGGEAILSAPARRWRRLVPAAVGLGLLASGLGGWFLAASRSKGEAPAAPTFKRLTFRQGGLHNARISPDGQTVYYGATWDGEPSRLYVTRTDSPESRALDFPPEHRHPGDLLHGRARDSPRRTVGRAERSRPSRWPEESLDSFSRRCPTPAPTGRRTDGSSPSCAAWRRELRLEFPIGTRDSGGSEGRSPVFRGFLRART